MATNISEEQRHAVEAAQGQPVEIFDPVKNSRFLLVRAEEFEAMRAIVAADDWSPREMYPKMADVMADEWSDPAMDSYDRQP